LGHIQKDLQTKIQQTSETRFALFDLKMKLTKTQHTLSKTEHELIVAQDSEERITRERRDYKIQTEDISQKLKETQEELTKTKHELSDLQEDYKVFVRQHEAMINDLESELYAELRRTDENRRERFFISKEIDHLRVYLIPIQGQKKVEEENPEFMQRWLDQVREERLSEVKKLKENLSKAKPKELSLKELQTAFQNGMNLLTPEEREELGGELADLNPIMQKMSMPTKERLTMFVTFVEEQIPPGVVREIGRLLKIQVEGQLHPLKCAVYLLNLSKRDCKLDPKLKLKEVLLDRLAEERYHRKKKKEQDVAACKIVILEGGEDNEV